MTDDNKNKAIKIIEKLRLVESEIFRLSSKYGVKTVDELDLLIKKGRLNEEDTGNEVFLFDYLVSEKESLEKELKKLEISKGMIWKNFQSLLELPKLSFQT
ncbi:hypothetical protein CO165_00655 [Candidatus Roizmanbacteria bacterium CG_4_9_14_3_um_filter_33_18]|uniref:Uncharacterized protein n=1 Tax=Candidatus Roizmanbacteria bacterium CG_4_9_14_3_um_filter_33_18 TaxID=1974841 RepID=A0A2M7XZ51_9BACT|nr:MAG: hypothetical protein CO165_00655 [Candidatus Roizmanbacteria bacterium CG_4_9_14_3_um_filter_33_18]